MWPLRTAPLAALVAGCTLVACARRAPLPVSAPPALLRAAEGTLTAGTQVYEGTVRARGGEGPVLYRYERRVEATTDGLRATHLTRTSAGRAVVLQQAVHGPATGLTHFSEHHGQTGVVGQVVVTAEGTVVYTTQSAGRTRQRTERQGDPLVVGPTLFDHVRDHWALLEGGGVVPLRFVVVEWRRSVRFELRMVGQTAESTTVELVPARRLVAATVPVAQMEFDVDRKIVRYQGVVPPRRLEDGGRLDADVRYRHSER